MDLATTCQSRGKHGRRCWAWDSLFWPSTVRPAPLVKTQGVTRHDTKPGALGWPSEVLPFLVLGARGREAPCHFSRRRIRGIWMLASISMFLGRADRHHHHRTPTRCQRGQGAFNQASELTVRQAHGLGLAIEGEVASGWAVAVGGGQWAGGSGSRSGSTTRNKSQGSQG